MKLSKLLKEISSSKGGTINDSWYNIANTADEIDGENLGIDGYPIYTQRLGASEDGKTNDEISIRYGDGHRDYFTIYDYKFGEDPTDEDNYQKEYPFSIGVPTGNKDAIRYAMKLGFKVEGMPKSDAEMDDEEREDFYAGLADKDIPDDAGVVREDETIDENIDGGVEFFKRIAFKK